MPDDADREATIGSAGMLIIAIAIAFQHRQADIGDDHIPQMPEQERRSEERMHVEVQVGLIRITLCGCNNSGNVFLKVSAFR